MKCCPVRTTFDIIAVAVEADRWVRKSPDWGKGDLIPNIPDSPLKRLPRARCPTSLGELTNSPGGTQSKPSAHSRTSTFIGVQHSRVEVKIMEKTVKKRNEVLHVLS